MGLKQIISSAVDSIFLSLSDLLKSGKLEGKVTESFDFSSKKLISDKYSFNVNFVELTSTVLEDGSVKKELLFRAKDLDPSLYSVVSYDNQTFRFESVAQYEGALIITVRSA